MRFGKYRIKIDLDILWIGVPDLFLGDIGFDFEEKPAQDEDDAGIEEILAGAEAINSSFEARYGYPWIPVGATVTASRRLKGIKEGECYTVSRSDVTDDGPTIWLEGVACCYRMDRFEEVEEVEEVEG